MKIEFVKETKVNGESFYFTNIDGRFVNGSLSYKQDEAKKIYNNLVKNKGKIDFTEILESVEVEVAK